MPTTDPSQIEEATRVRTPIERRMTEEDRLRNREQGVVIDQAIKYLAAKTCMGDYMKWQYIFGSRVLDPEEKTTFLFGFWVYFKLFLPHATFLLLGTRLGRSGVLNNLKTEVSPHTVKYPC